MAHTARCSAPRTGLRWALATRRRLTILSGVLLLWGGHAAAQFDRPWRVYAVPYSHMDVGYTASVPAVIESHERELDTVAAWITKTAGNAEGSRFKWTVEIPWVLPSYIRDRSPAQVEELMNLARNGSIEIGALHFGLQSDLCGNEELVRSLSYAQKLRTAYGIPVRTGMIDDTPGIAWSLAQLMQKSDVPYLSVAMNSFLCDFFKTTNLPDLFYLQGQGGDRVLVWRSIDSLWAYLEGGITLGVYGGYANFESKLTALLTNLSLRGYPYDEVFINCATGDNGPPSMAIVGNVQAWNSVHADAKVRIATVSEFFDTVSAKYSGRIPVFSGDAPNWWSWLFSPSASGVCAESRRAQVLLPAAEMMSAAASIWDPAYSYPGESLDEAYVNNLLVEDHNLGTASNSASGNADFWARKTGWADAAYDTAQSVLNGALRAIGRNIPTDARGSIVVFNPSAWERSGIVTVQVTDPALLGLSGFSLVDSRTGNPVTLQRASAFSIAFAAEDVPALGYRTYRFAGGDPLPAQRTLAGSVLENSFYRVSIDNATGSVKAILDKSMGANIVSADGVFNLYRFNSSGVPSLSVMSSDSGAVFQRITLSGSAPGTSSFLAEITLPATEKKIDTRTTFYRLTPVSTTGEVIDFNFDVAATAPFLRYEIPFGNVGLFVDELSGFRSKHYAPQRWIYMSLDGGAQGVTLATAESPIIAAAGASFNGSLRLLTQYNNTASAYRAGVGSQEMAFSVTSGAEGFRPEAATMFSWSAFTPMPVIVIPPGQKGGGLPDTAGSLLDVTPSRLQLTTIKRAWDGDGLIVRLFNPSNEMVAASVRFRGAIQKAAETSLQEVDRKPLAPSGNTLSLTFGSYEIKTLRVNLPGVSSVGPAAAVPGEVRLMQNYPNPFNPTTVISCRLPAAGRVRIAVYDLLGREVAVVADGRMEAGAHSFTFDGSRLASGVYFTRLEAAADGGTAVRRVRSMILVR
jgi:alpha-mannosidase